MRTGFLSVVALALMASADHTGRQDLLTTGLATTSVDVAYLDDAGDPLFTALDDSHRDAAGGFLLEPGAYQGVFESYCLLPGTHGPVTGDGYLTAPIEGDASGVVLAVLERSHAHPELPQQDIQQLLWAILSRAPYSQLGAEVQHAAATLLTRDEIRQVEALSGESMTDRLRGALLSRAPSSVQGAIDAYDRLRSLLTDASATYEEMRRVAVLDGPPPPQAGDREVPATRWSYHPDGYFVRYLPEGYTQTTVQIVVPGSERPSLARDDRGRIVRASYAGGFVVEAEYDDTIPALVLDDAPDVRGYAFRRLRYSNGVDEAVIENTGWTFVSVPPGAVPAAAPSTDDVIETPGHGPSVDQEGWRQRYDRAKERYERFKELQEAREADRAREARERDGPSSRDVDDVTDEGHYRDGYDAATKGEASDKLDWIDEQMRRVRNAWEYASCRLSGGCEDPDDGEKKPRRKRVRPSRDAAVPGAQGGQRLGVGGRLRR